MRNSFLFILFCSFCLDTKRTKKSRVILGNFCDSIVKPLTNLITSCSFSLMRDALPFDSQLFLKPPLLTTISIKY